MRNTSISSVLLCLAQIRSSELQVKHTYRLRWGVLAIAVFTVLIGTVMEFSGLHGSVNWVVGAPHLIDANLKDVSPGIVLVTIGMVLCCVVILCKPVKLQLGQDGTLGMHQPIPFIRRNEPEL